VSRHGSSRHGSNKRMIEWNSNSNIPAFPVMGNIVSIVLADSTVACACAIARQFVSIVRVQLFVASPKLRLFLAIQINLPPASFNETNRNLILKKNFSLFVVKFYILLHF
jgi:hypothetical protein